MENTFNTAGFVADYKKPNGKICHECKLFMWDGDPLLNLKDAIQFIRNEYRKAGCTLDTLIYVPGVRTLKELEQVEARFPAGFTDFRKMPAVVYMSDSAAKELEREVADYKKDPDAFRKKYSL